jgi:hypothetical protein
VSITIELEFETHVDLDLVERGVVVRLIRLAASVQLQTREGWTRKYKALVDTGNPISIIPNSIWRKAKIDQISSALALPAPCSLLLCSLRPAYFQMS